MTSMVSCKKDAILHEMLAPILENLTDLEI